ncbi:MAG: hypothetical protein Q8J68_06420 [Methanolobus sp.]|nr:hypothetical protein [Methanolobus sp.]
MTTEVTVNSNICNLTHRIKGENKGETIEISIESPCDKIQSMQHMEVPVMEIFGFRDNCVVRMAEEAGCDVTCIVPCAILHVCHIESGMMSRSLVKQAGNISIAFEK